MSSPNFEEDVTNLMDGMLKVALVCYPEVSEPVMRAKIVSTNLKALVNIILMGDDPKSGVKVNLKQICLGLLTTADWLDPEEVPDAFPGNEGLSAN